MLDLTKTLSQKFPKLKFGFNETKTAFSVSTTDFRLNVRRQVNPSLSLQEYANIFVEMVKELRGKITSVRQAKTD